MTPARGSGWRAADRWRNQAKHQAAELRRVACQLRRAAAPTLALKIAAGRIEAIADDIKSVSAGPDVQKAGGGKSL